MIAAQSQRIILPARMEVLQGPKRQIKGKQTDKRGRLVTKGIAGRGPLRAVAQRAVRELVAIPHATLPAMTFLSMTGRRLLQDDF
jgi:hypothetical protein